jgi:hypothetical protein
MVNSLAVKKGRSSPQRSSRGFVESKMQELQGN